MNWQQLLAPIMNRRALHRQAWGGLASMLLECEPDVIAGFVKRLQDCNTIAALSDTDMALVRRLAMTAVMEGLVRIGEQIELETN